MKYLVGAVVCGVLVSLATGIIENAPQASIIGSRYYGYPLVWRITMTLQPDKLDFTTLAIDSLFWIMISSVVLTVVLKRGLSKPKG